MKNESRNLKLEQGRATAERLLDIAHRSFATKGFGATRTEDIIAEAGVTKGALYHHYRSKRDLFEAVYRGAEDAVAGHIGRAVAGCETAWEQLCAGCFAYLDACQDPGLQQILRVDGPSVLGLSSWAKIDREYGVDRLLPVLQNLSDGGVIDVPSAEAFAWQLTGAMNEATFWIAQHRNPAKALADSKKVLQVLLESAKSK